jgi:hypothetical protein
MMEINAVRELTDFGARNNPKAQVKITKEDNLGLVSENKSERRISFSR